MPATKKIEKPFNLGLIEGFFGLAWSWESRKAYIDFLSQQGFNTYIYAPKSDSYLRKNWQQAFPPEHLLKLKDLSFHYLNAGLNFGIGLSPYELYQDFNDTKKFQLEAKLNEINQINPAVLCILFDDMQGDFPDLAQRQVEIMSFVTEYSQAQNFIFCPTYYSDDAMLDKHFGKRPESYLEDLGRLLDPEIDIFWTGPEVISKDYPLEHLKSITQKLQRKPLIWDNYPVNDGKTLTNFLHLRPSPDRDLELREACSGLMANPMNQSFLSQLPLYSLNSSLQGKPPSLCPDELAKIIMQDAPLLQDLGLDNLSLKEKEQLNIKYSAFPNEPMAQEILAWLKGVYTFDPACLT